MKLRYLKYNTFSFLIGLFVFAGTAFILLLLVVAGMQDRTNDPLMDIACILSVLLASFAQSYSFREEKQTIRNSLQNEQEKCGFIRFCKAIGVLYSSAIILFISFLFCIAVFDLGIIKSEIMGVFSFLIITILGITVSVKRINQMWNDTPVKNQYSAMNTNNTINYFPKAWVIKKDEPNKEQVTTSEKEREPDEEFIEKCIKALKEMGYEIEKSPMGKRQHGVDLLVFEGDRSYVVRCEGFGPTYIGSSVIRELVEGREYYNTTNALLIHARELTDDASNLVETTGVTLAIAEIKST